MKEVWHRWSSDWASPGAISPTPDRMMTRQQTQLCTLSCPNSLQVKSLKNWVSGKYLRSEGVGALNSLYYYIFSSEGVVLSAQVAPQLITSVESYLALFLKPCYQAFCSTGCHLCYILRVSKTINGKVIISWLISELIHRKWDTFHIWQDKIFISLFYCTSSAAFWNVNLSLLWFPKLLL